MKKIACLVLAVLMLGLVACGGGASTSSSATPPVAGSSSSLVSSVSEDPIVLNQAFLTGYEKDVDYPEGKRLTAIMVNNIVGSRPTRGLSEAQILVESRVEGGITRFMALYQDYETIPVVGSVRSARDQFFQMILPFQAFYLHDGESVPMSTYFNVYPYDGWNLDAGWYGDHRYTNDPDSVTKMTWRDANRKAAGFTTEYTLYTSGKHITQTIENQGLDGYRLYTSTFFNFVPYTEPARVPEKGSISSINVQHSPLGGECYQTLFNYDAATGRYAMDLYNYGSKSYAPAIDENNNEHISFDNVFVVFADMSEYPGSGSVKDFDLSQGIGYYFTQGGYELMHWKKGAPEQAMLFYHIDGSGEPVMVNPGTSYIAIVSTEYLENFDAQFTA